MKRVLNLVLTILFVGFSFVSFSQYKYLVDQSSMVVFGTSNVHDWTLECEGVTGTLNAKLDGVKISKVTGISMNIPVKGMKSGKSGMDTNTQKALKESENPNITYTIKSYGEKDGVVHLTGSLTVAGVTKEVKFPASYEVAGDKIKFKGSYAFKMTDFGVEPPTAVMGTIKCGDELKFDFDITFSK
jgi:polyisoprenoid-binding protein YceI